MNAWGIKILKSFESCRLTAYPDPASGGAPWTCGWGSTGEDIHRGTFWTQAQADARLSADLDHFERGVRKLLDVELTEDQVSALVDFAYNEGLGKLAGSTLLKHINAGEHDEAAQIEKWHFSGGQDMRGLRARRAAEACLFASDYLGVQAILDAR